MVRKTWFLVAWPIIVGVIAIVVAVVVTGQQTTSKMNKVDTNLALWNIQPGLGTVMMEYATRMDNLWQAEQAGNWDMATYQISEMLEIQETGETTRPARADALKKFENDYLNPLTASAKAKDKAQFEANYDKAITGCNQCHGEQKDANGNTFRWIVIQRPTNPAPFSNVRWAAQ